MRNKKHNISIILPLVVIISIALFVRSYLEVPKESEVVAEKVSASPSRISVMTYNVENLFDTQDDPSKKDAAFLPKNKKNNDKHVQACQKIKSQKWRDQCLYLDWSKGVVHQKMSQLSRAILQKGTDGPDILILQEVENKAVLTLFVEKYLHKSGYITVSLHEGRDVRGIDVAVVSRFPLSGKVQLHPIPLRGVSDKKSYDSRGVLEVPLQTPSGESIIVYANHFPAPYHSHHYRIKGFEFIRSLQQRYPKALQIAAGDFNVPADEDQKYRMLESYVEPYWQLAHKQCRGCQGSSYYPPKKQWSFLDMVLLSKNITLHDVSVVKEAWMLTKKGYPKSFSFRTGNGASDHLPVYVEISL